MNNNYLKKVIMLVLLAVILLIPATGNIHWTRVLVEIGIWTVVALGFRLILTTGIASLAHISFMGVGAYTVAILTTRLQINFWLCFLLAGMFTAMWAMVIGSIALRAKGIHFALATYAISEVVRLIWVEWKSLFGGVGGIPNIPAPDPLLGITFGSAASYYYVSLGLVLITMVIMNRIEKSRFGRILLTLEKSESLSQSVGIDTFRLKWIAFIVGSAFAGFAGALFASFYHYIGPEEFGIQQTFVVLIYVLAGGVQTLYGSFLGVFVLMMSLKLIHHVPGFNPVWEPLFLGSTLLVIMKCLPEGIISIWGKKRVTG